MKSIFRLFAVFILAGASTAFAQGWPNKPIHVIIPWPPGQATDLAMRMVAEKLAPVLGQPLIKAVHVPYIGPLEPASRV